MPSARIWKATGRYSNLTLENVKPEGETETKKAWVTYRPVRNENRTVSADMFDLKHIEQAAQK